MYGWHHSEELESWGSVWLCMLAERFLNVTCILTAGLPPRGHICCSFWRRQFCNFWIATVSWWWNIMNLAWFIVRLCLNEWTRCCEGFGDLCFCYFAFCESECWPGLGPRESFLLLVLTFLVWQGALFHAYVFHQTEVLCQGKRVNSS